MLFAQGPLWRGCRRHGKQLILSACLQSPSFSFKLCLFSSGTSKAVTQGLFSLSHSQLSLENLLPQFSWGSLQPAKPFPFCYPAAQALPHEKTDKCLLGEWLGKGRGCSCFTNTGFLGPKTDLSNVTPQKHVEFLSGPAGEAAEGGETWKFDECVNKWTSLTDESRHPPNRGLWKCNFTWLAFT